jgi:hypothetical protein
MCYRKSNMKGQSMKRLLVVVVIGLAVLTGSVAIRGDCGAIPMVPFGHKVSLDFVVKVFEPNQRAILAWSGQEEILILSTDLKASEPVKVLEVMPFPSKPTVKAGSMKTFTRAIGIINDYERAHPKRMSVVSGGGSYATAGGDSDEGSERTTRKIVVVTPPPAEIVFQKQIDATDVNVVHVLRQKGFIEWVQKFVRDQKLNEASIPDVLKKTVTEYLDDGCEWFAFNVVSLTNEARSKTAVEYRFDTHCLYYPLRISRTDSGDTAVSLLVLTKKLLRPYQFTGVPMSKISRPNDPVPIYARQLSDFHGDIYDLLGWPPYAKLRIWEITGELGSFDQDLVAGLPRRFTLTDGEAKKTYGPFDLVRGARCNVAGTPYIVKIDVTALGDAPRFHLRGDRSQHGYMDYKDGMQLKLDGMSYTLNTVRVVIGTKTVSK